MERGDNPDSPDGSESQASTDGKDSKDKDTEDMKQSDGKRANGSQDPPPQYADMAGQAPIQSGPTPPGVSIVKILLICFAIYSTVHTF